jgi:alpha-L-arabinofuranosidase
MKKILLFLLIALPGTLLAQNAKIKIDTERSIGEINPKIYDEFMEPIQLSGRRGLPDLKQRIINLLALSRHTFLLK